VPLQAAGQRGRDRLRVNCASTTRSPRSRSSVRGCAPPGCLGHLLPGARRCRHQRGDDLDLGDPHLGGHPRRGRAKAVRGAAHRVRARRRGRGCRLRGDGPMSAVCRSISVSSARPARSVVSCCGSSPSVTSRSVNVRLFASARSAGSTITWQGRDIVVEDAATADPTGLRHRDLLRRCHDLARPGPEVRCGRRHRHRQLVGLADGPRRAAGRLRGQPGRGQGRPEGDHRQPQLHDDGGDAGAQAAADEAGLTRLIVSTYQAVSGTGLAGVQELAEQVRRALDGGDIEALTHDGPRSTSVPR
jgi:hypothetical protein